MHGALLRTGKSDDFIAVGETGQPVYKAALQLIAALTRKSPALALFLAVPKSNEQGSVIDWYSPVQGDVVPWSSATEAETEEARSQLIHFKNTIADMSLALVQAGNKGGQSDQVIFGKLLGLVPHAPSENYLYLVQAKRTNAQGEIEHYTQPVLSFWGFVQHEGDRHRDPLYFLTPAPIVAPPATLTAPASVTAPETPISLTKNVRPWWRRFWWLWPLLLLLLALLLFGLLRGCIPTVTLPVGSVSLPATTTTTTIDTSNLNNPSGNVVPGGATLPASEIPANGQLPSLPATEPATTTPEPKTEPVPEAGEPQPAEPPAPEPASPPTTAAEPAQSSAPVAPGTPLSIPPDIAEGPADFLNGNYRAGAGIMDAKTSKPLRLEYAFEKGQGNVTIRRPDGVSCTGAVNAAMNAGNLGIHSQDQASCTDGSRYDMPQVSCKPGAQSIADCQGNYGNTQFPMSMRRE
ncbi:SrfA family protein [Pseudomonas viridiflava]|uniref:SrfA family protein n=1 Tax=Pseudomonas viridiflava TaxID=33069 RepID=UPI000F04DB40|nr:SrfA family protein [Pseudomonas viridiflava]